MDRLFCLRVHRGHRPETRGASWNGSRRLDIIRFGLAKTDRGQESDDRAPPAAEARGDSARGPLGLWASERTWGGREREGDGRGAKNPQGRGKLRGVGHLSKAGGSQAWAMGYSLALLLALLLPSVGGCHAFLILSLLSTAERLLSLRRIRVASCRCLAFLSLMG
jgi:hypothetical protein